jgi:hypothetical protein
LKTEVCMNGVNGIPATMRLVCSRGERIIDNTLHGWLDGEGTFHYTQLMGGRGPKDMTIPKATTLVDSRTVITLNDDFMIIQRDEENNLQVAMRGGYTENNFSVNTIKPTQITRGGKEVLANPSFSVGQDVISNGQTNRVVVVFEAPQVT